MCGYLKFSRFLEAFCFEVPKFVSESALHPLPNWRSAMCVCGCFLLNLLQNVHFLPFEDLLTSPLNWSVLTLSTFALVLTFCSSFNSFFSLTFQDKTTALISLLCTFFVVVLFCFWLIKSLIFLHFDLFSISNTYMVKSLHHSYFKGIFLDHRRQEGQATRKPGRFTSLSYKPSTNVCSPVFVR